MDYNLQKYIAFITAVDNGSITGASEILNYSQSGISRMIGDLEKDWQMSLLERNKYGVELTSDGVRLLPQIRAVCNEFQKLTTDVEELQGLETGLIRIGTISSVATHVLPPVIQKFKNDYKGVKYELLLGDYNEIEKWVQSGRVDIGFVLMPTKDSFDTITYGTDEMKIVLPNSAGRNREISFYPAGEGQQYQQPGIFPEERNQSEGGFCDVGRLCHHVHGGKRTGHQRASGTDFEALLL